MPKFKVPKLLKSVRYSLAAVNCVFLLTGILLLIVGIVILVSFKEYDEFMTNRFYSLGGFAIATGVIIILTSTLGFYGAFTEQFYFIAGYVVLLLAILVFQVSIVIVGYSLSNDAATEIRTPMVQSIQLYETRVEIAKIWDDVQMEFECCGVAGRYDWVSNRIPVSCCHIDYGTVSPFECTSANAHSTGCASALGEWLGYKTYVIAVSTLVITCLQVLITAMAGWLAWRSKFEEVELES